MQLPNSPGPVYTGLGFLMVETYYRNTMTDKLPDKFTATPFVPDNDTISRRTLFRLGLATSILTVGGLVYRVSSAAETNATPRETEGPFYPIHTQLDKDTDLTHIEGHSKSAAGEAIHVGGTVFDTQGNTLQGVFIDIWQANTWGRYRHARDPNSAPLDPDFQGWGQTLTDEMGRYEFKTILPGAYPAGPGWTRPPHIHFKVSKSGFAPLTTQMYFSGQALNDIDLILQQHRPEMQKLLIANRASPDAAPISKFRFDIYLQ